ncbi:MAG: HAMP domain-containing histidine kinase [Planctomycetaceae bacterium]|jgi:signal transduction histidine kinase|nr:HAMP domain-containing histidine kinase [Planctomycetaceae bacterium]
MINKDNLPFWSILAPEHAATLERLFQAELERQKMEALAEFAAGAGHEINNPLTIIGGRAQMLLQEITHPEQQKHLLSILAQVRRAYEMIADIRLFARPPKPVLSNTNISEILRTVVLRFSESENLQEKNDANSAKTITWDLHNVADNVTMFLDSSFLETIFAVLCKNAIEAIDVKGIIKISCEYCKNSCHFNKTTDNKDCDNAEEQQLILRSTPYSAVILFEDDGPGFPEKHLPHLFSPYFSGRQAGRGLGFGLPKAWRLLELMGGTIHAENRVPHGAKFTIQISTNGNFSSYEN